MSIAITGDLSPRVKLLEYNSDANGQTYSLGASGAAAFVEPLLAGFILKASSVNYRLDGALAHITARYAGPRPGTTEVPKNSLSLKTTEQTLLLYANKRYAGLPQSVVKAVRAAVDDTSMTHADGRAAINAAVLLTTSDPTAAAAMTLLAIELFDWILNGSDSFQTTLRTITRTQYVSQNYSVALSQADMELIFSVIQLATVLGTALPFAVPAITLTADEIAKGYIVGWRKTQCDVEDTANYQRTLVESWTLAKWSGNHYDIKAS